LEERVEPAAGDDRQKKLLIGQNVSALWDIFVDTDHKPIAYFSVRANTQKEVNEVFRRLNTGGVSLTQLELVLGKIKAVYSDYEERLWTLAERIEKDAGSVEPAIRHAGCLTRAWAKARSQRPKWTRGPVRLGNVAQSGLGHKPGHRAICMVVGPHSGPYRSRCYRRVRCADRPRPAGTMIKARSLVGANPTWIVASFDPRKSSSHTETQRSQRFSMPYAGRGSRPRGDRRDAFNELFFFVFSVSWCEQFPDLS